MEEENWGDEFAKSFAVFLNGGALTDLRPRGERVINDTFYLIFNASWETVMFRLPAPQYGGQWQKILDTVESEFKDDGPVFRTGEEVDVASRSLNLFRCSSCHVTLRERI